MKKSNDLSRRSFIKQSAIAGSALLMPKNVLAMNSFKDNKTLNEDLKVFIFSKHLQFLSYKEMSEAAKDMGFDGVDLTVRPKGHVLPERVAEDLPKATEVMESFGLLSQMLSTNVIDANNPVHRKVLETASRLGYQYYRPAWIRYKNELAVVKTFEDAKHRLKDLAQLNKELGISASYHNHSGHFFGGAIWDLYQAVEPLSPKDIGCQYDILHANVEGGKNWEIGFRLIKPYINTLVVKDYIWKKVNGKWQPYFTPIGEGMVDFKKYFSLLKQNQINVPMSIHVEYDLGGAEHGAKPSMPHKEVLSKIKKDLDFVRKCWAEAQ